MDKKDIEFLRELRNEMLTQETDYQAAPRFWVIMQEEKEYNISDDTGNIFIASDYEGESLFEGVFCSDEFRKWFKEFVEKETESKVVITDESDLGFEFEDCEYYLTDIEEVEEFLIDNCNVDLTIGYYRMRNVIKEDTLFITKKEAEKHLKQNSHHYNNTAHTFAMTAWRSPQVERLLKILENTEWEKELKE